MTIVWLGPDMTVEVRGAQLVVASGVTYTGAVAEELAAQHPTLTREVDEAGALWRAV